MSSFSFPDIKPYIDSFRESLPPQLQVYFTQHNIQLLLRGVVVIATFLLFQPHLESLFRKVTGTPDQRQEEIKERLEFLRQQREGGGGAPPKNVGIVGKDGSVQRVVAPKQAEGGTQSPSGGKKGKAKGGKKKA